MGRLRFFAIITFEQEVDRMKQRVYFTGLHQLRTPLSAIKTYTHMLNEGTWANLTLPSQRLSIHYWLF